MWKFCELRLSVISNVTTQKCNISYHGEVYIASKIMPHFWFLCLQMIEVTECKLFSLYLFWLIFPLFSTALHFRTQSSGGYLPGNKLGFICYILNFIQTSTNSHIYLDRLPSLYSYMLDLKLHSNHLNSSPGTVALFFKSLGQVCQVLQNKFSIYFEVFLSIFSVLLLYSCFFSSHFFNLLV
jgi:hypothetical protein